jgi:hypothetical protein
MNNITTETTVAGALKAYMTTASVSDMSRDPRLIEDVLHDQGISYTSEVIAARDGDPKTRVLKYTNKSGWKRTVLASLDGPGIEGAYYDRYDYFSGVVALSRDDWLIVAEKLERKYS